jgi:hypothetical protein
MTTYSFTARAKCVSLAFWLDARRQLNDVLAASVFVAAMALLSSPAHPRPAVCLLRPVHAVGPAGRTIEEAKRLAILEWSRSAARLHGESYSLWEISQGRKFWRPAGQTVPRFVVMATPCRAPHIRED